MLLLGEPDERSAPALGQCAGAVLGAASIQELDLHFAADLHLMMFAAGADIPYVMGQVGHSDSKVTLKIYAQVLKRLDREQIGRAFDHLLVGGGKGEPRTAARAARRPTSRPKTAARSGRNPG